MCTAAKSMVQSSAEAADIIEVKVIEHCNGAKRAQSRFYVVCGSRVRRSKH